ncbi:hypothetical protein GDO81_027172 [Engystomops pustulosus]|uniref:Uncharacterized protein n=1 Tax=Engystomops pustulosus TaxID=76066 RepID=A0AAV6YFT8_ENGPU|nr:hypothetical protein GDO81_027172 [Engystomops pustulosus]
MGRLARASASTPASGPTTCWEEPDTLCQTSSPPLSNALIHCIPPCLILGATSPHPLRLLFFCVSLMSRNHPVTL